MIANYKSITVETNNGPKVMKVMDNSDFIRLLQKARFCVSRFAGKIKDSHFDSTQYIVLIVSGGRNSTLFEGLGFHGYKFASQNMEGGDQRIIVELKKPIESIEEYLLHFDKWQELYPEIKDDTRRVDYVLEPQTGPVGWL